MSSSSPLRSPALWGLLFIVTVVAGSAGPLSHAGAAYRPGELVIYVRPGEITLPAGGEASLEEAQFRSEALYERLAAEGVRALTSFGQIWHGADTEAGMIDFANFFRLTVPRSADVEALAERLAELPEVVIAEPRPEYVWLSPPNDPLYPDQWHLENTGNLDGLPDVDIDVERAWDYGQGTAVDVYVLDTGTDTHVDIRGGNAFVCAGSYEITNPHGTNVSGLIAGKVDNGIGIAGISRISPVVGIKIGDSSPTDPECGLATAANFGARIASNSWGTFPGPGSIYEYSVSLASAVRNLYLSGSHGCLVVCGNGNFGSQWEYCDPEYLPPTLMDDTDDPIYPAGFTKTALAVGAIVKGGRPWHASNNGWHLDITAPGGSEITTTDMYGGYTGSFGGTSAATPVVSGVAALLLETNPNLYNADLEYILERTATDIEPFGWDKYTGEGKVNAGRAVRFISGPQRQVVQGTIPAEEVQVTEISDFSTRRFRHLGIVFNDPTLPDEITQFIVKRIRLEGTAVFTTGDLDDPRNAWVRPKDGLSPGWDNTSPYPFFDALTEVGWGAVDASDWSNSHATLYTYLWELYNEADTSLVGIFPTEIDDVEIPYTAVLGPFDDAPFVDVQQPNGGEPWRAGQTHDITWIASDDDGVDSVSIYWSLDLGETWPEELVTGIPNNGTWSWAITNDTDGSRCSRVAVVAHDAAGDNNYDMSDGNFQVKPPPTAHEVPFGQEQDPIITRAWVEPQGIIGFTLAQREEVMVTVFDVEGRRVRRLAGAAFDRGAHEVQWNLRDDAGNPVSRGLYLYRFEAGDYESSGKIVVIGRRGP